MKRDYIRYAAPGLLLTAAARSQAQGTAAQPVTMAASAPEPSASGIEVEGWRRPDVLIIIVLAFVVGVALGYWLRGIAGNKTRG